METSNKLVRRQLQQGRLRITYDTLCMAACIMYFAQDAIRVVVAMALPIFNSAVITWFMIILMYLPLVGAYMITPLRISAAVERFFLLFLIVVVFFLGTYLIHPEYSSWFFKSSYRVFDWIFRPNQYIFAYLFISVVRKPEDGIRALKTAGYLLLVYYTYRLLKANFVGYWITTTTAAGPQHSAYDLSYGYDHLLVFAIFFGCGFKERNPLYFILSGISFIEIVLGGSRGPLLAIAIMMILMYLRYRHRMNKAIRVLIIFGVTFLVTLYFVLGFEGIVVLMGSFLSRILRSSSRTIQYMLGGSGIFESSGRDRLYDIAIEMIKNGFWGYGAYGDRYVIGRTFWVGYAHNIFLEFLIDFGWIIGGFFIIRMAIAVFKMVFRCKDENWYMLFTIFLISSLKLFLSGSFWYSEAFWAAIAVCRMYRRFEKRRGQLGMSK